MSGDSPTDITTAQVAEVKALMELMNSRANEYVEMAKQIIDKAKETTETEVATVTEVAEAVSE